MPKSLELKNVGPIEALQIPVPEGGGVVVLRGRNGLGKSHALDAVESLVSSGKRGRVVTRDGAPSAAVEGFGAAVNFVRRTARGGTLEVSALTGADPFVFVDPGLKDADAADGERIKVLLRLAGAELDIAPFERLLGGPEALRAVAKTATLRSTDVVTLSAALKRDLHAAARELEEAEAREFEVARGIEASLADVPRGEPDPSIREAYDAAAVELAACERAAADSERAQAALKAAQVALDDLGTRGTPEAVESAQASHELAAAALEGLRTELSERQAAHRGAVEAMKERHRRELEELQGSQRAEAAAIDARITEARIAAVQAQAALDAARADVDRRAKAQRQVELAGKVRASDPDAVARARAEKDRLQVALEGQALLERAARQRAEAELHREKGLQARQRALDLRAKADACDRIVAEILAGVCPEGMRVVDGRVCVRTERSPSELFSDLSHGERTKLALEIAIRAVTRQSEQSGLQPVLVGKQEGWEALDPQNRSEIAERCREAGVVLITAACDEGELRAEVAA